MSLGPFILSISETEAVYFPKKIIKWIKNVEMKTRIRDLYLCTHLYFIKRAYLGMFWVHITTLTLPFTLPERFKKNG